MWSDNETDVDLLRYAYLASGVSRIVKSEHLLSTTVGVFGDWGSGKSSLLKMIRADLEKDPAVMCLTFDGWLFEGYEDAKTALMGSILDVIQERVEGNRTLLEKAGERLNKLRHRVNWFRLAAMAGRVVVPALMGIPDVTASVGLAEAVKAVATGAKQLTPEDAKKLLKEVPEGEDNLRRNIRDFRGDFGQLLKEAEIETLVVFIDDLDRCMPDTIIETLEAIKLVLFAPGTAFILGADERLVEYAVRLRFPELPNTEIEVGRNYLEKLVQFPIRLPPLNGVEVQSYANLLFAQLDLGPDSEDYKKVCDSVAQSRADSVSELSFDIQAARNLLGETAIIAELERDFDLVAQVAPVLAPGLSGNPRRVKRFLNTLLLRMVLGEDRGLSLQRQILAKLMLLEYIKPEFFKKLAELQASQGGKPSELAAVETHLRQNAPKGDGGDLEADGQGTAEEKVGSGLRKGSRKKAASKTRQPLEEELPPDV